MNKDAVITFKKYVADAFWELSLPEFCRRLGWLEDSYAKEKFQAFQNLARALGTFDAETLTKIIE